MNHSNKVIQGEKDLREDLGLKDQHEDILIIKSLLFGFFLGNAVGNSVRGFPKGPEECEEASNKKTHAT